MGRLKWDQTGERQFENGTDHGVLYVIGDNGVYGKAVAWNGLTGVTESPDGAEPNDLYADNIKYASLRSAETFGGTIEAYMYPDEFAECDGSIAVTKGVYVGQQKRKSFGLCYRTNIGTDVDGEAGYKLHLVYGATASPSEKGYESINDSPDGITFSWEFDTTPVEVGTIDGKLLKPTAIITIDSTEFVSDDDKATLNAFLDTLYGTDGDETNGVPATDGRLPSPAEVLNFFLDAS